MKAKIKAAIAKAIAWIKESNRWKHLLGGYAIGAGSDDAYCAAYCGVLVASALEYKDKAHGDKWDWTDWSLTLAGVALGYATRKVIQAVL